MVKSFAVMDGAVCQIHRRVFVPALDTALIKKFLQLHEYWLPRKLFTDMLPTI
jgi:hypothetical protein